LTPFFSCVRICEGLGITPGYSIGELKRLCVKNKIALSSNLYYNMYYGGDGMITLRLDPNLDQIVSNTAKNLGLSKSELVRKSLVEYIGKINNQDAWEVGKDLFGKYESGKNNLSSNRKALIKEKIKAKRK